MGIISSSPHETPNLKSKYKLNTKEYLSQYKEKGKRNCELKKTPILRTMKLCTTKHHQQPKLKPFMEEDLCPNGRKYGGFENRRFLKMDLNGRAGPHSQL